MLYEQCLNTHRDNCFPVFLKYHHDSEKLIFVVLWCRHLVGRNENWRRKMFSLCASAPTTAPCTAASHGGGDRLRPVTSPHCDVSSPPACSLEGVDPVQHRCAFLASSRYRRTSCSSSPSCSAEAANGSSAIASARLRPNEHKPASAALQDTKQNKKGSKNIT